MREASRPPRSSRSRATSISACRNYALHAKVYVFDRRQVFIGSMNYDQRSKHINTEIGLRASAVPGVSQQGLVWRTKENGENVERTREPARSGWQRVEVKLLTVLPLEREL